MGHFLATPFFLIRQTCLWIEAFLTGDIHIVLSVNDPEVAEMIMEALSGITDE